MKTPRKEPIKIDKVKKPTREEMLEYKRLLRIQQIENQKIIQEQMQQGQLFINPNLHKWEMNDVKIILQELEKTRPYITPLQNNFINQKLIPQSLNWGRVRTAEELKILHRFNQVIKAKYCDNCEAPECCYIHTQSHYMEPCVFLDVKDRQCKIYPNRPYACKAATCDKIPKEEVIAIFERLGLTDVSVHKYGGDQNEDNYSKPSP